MKQKKGDSKKLTSQRLLANRPIEPEEKPATSFEVAAARLSPDEIAEPKQRELLAAPEEASRPQPVQNGRMLVTYVGLGLERDKDGEKLIHLDFSLPLEDAHDDLVPKRVKDAWEWLKSSGNPLVQVGDLPAVTVGIYLDPKEKKPMLKMVGAAFRKAVIAVVEETGKGKSRLVTRFKFRFVVDREKPILEFAAWHDSEEFWLKMETTQKELDLE